MGLPPPSGSPLAVRRARFLAIRSQIMSSLRAWEGGVVRREGGVVGRGGKNKRDRKMGVNG